MSNTTNPAATATKPKWVEALEQSERMLAKAENATSAEDQGSLNAMAHTWLAIAREYRGDSPSTFSNQSTKGTT